jgi:hypothetical protein
MAISFFKIGQRGEQMIYLKKSILDCFLKVFLIMCFFCPAEAQYIKISKFNGAAIPFNLKYENSLIEKGKYDLELLKHQTQLLFYLRIKKRSKILVSVSGEKLMYESYGDAGLFNDPNIPDDARIKFSKIPEEKIVNIIFESGKKNPIYPCIMLRFRMEYEE